MRRLEYNPYSNLRESFRSYLIEYQLQILEERNRLDGLIQNEKLEYTTEVAGWCYVMETLVREIQMDLEWLS